MATVVGTQLRGPAGASRPAGDPRLVAPPSTGAPVERPVLLSGTALLFAALLSMILVEYTGLAKDVPILKIIRYSTVVAYGLLAFVIGRLGPKALIEYPQSKALLAFVGFTGFTILYAVVRSYVPASLRAHVDYFALYVTTLYLVDRPRRFDLLSITCSAITIALVIRNFPKFLEEQRVATFTAGYFMGDGNDFAWGLVTLLPFPAYLILGKRSIVMRLFGVAALGLGLLGVLGTKSRGAALAVGAAGLFYWLFLARRRAAAAIGLAVIVAGAAVVAPHGYFDRLKTIEHYEEDTSAQGRLRAWNAAMQMAIDYPLGVGAGSFNSAFGRFYMPAHVEGYAPNRWISAHSVYFKVLGEYGIVGVLIVVFVIISAVRVNLASLWKIRADPSRYPISDMWPALLALGVVGYAVGAGFLGGINYPHLYFLTGLTMGCHRALLAAEPDPALAAGVPAPPTAAAGPPLPGRRATATSMVRARPVTRGKRRFFE